MIVCSGEWISQEYTVTCVRVSVASLKTRFGEKVTPIFGIEIVSGTRSKRISALRRLERKRSVQYKG